MKRAFLFAAAAVATISLAACQKKDSTATPADPGTSNEAVNAAQDATSAAVGATSAATVGQVSTDAFVTNAAISDMYEIQAGQIAQKKGQSAGVKDFGKMMVTEHTAMSNEMKPLVTAAGKTLPTGLDERRKGLIDNLNAAPAADFDKTYLSQQEAAHNEALSLMQGYADNGDDAGLKGAAAKAVPKVQAHLDKVRELQAAPATAPAKK
jgi:putative membrane protein